MAELWQQTATELADQVRRREVSATEVTEAHLARQDAVNPALNAVVQQFPEEALASARAVDATLAGGGDPGPLAGVPVTVKVNVDQAGHATTNGLRLQADLIAERDSPLVANMRAAGAVIVGRTNTPAFSLRWFTRNSLHGQTLNPRNAALTPGGSSGGAASAVAAGLCAIGHGTDIAGSIRYPAYACGLQGLRPTLGRVPAWNASAPDRMIGAQLMAVSGPMTRSMADLELAFRVMSAAAPGDPWWVPVPQLLGAYEKRATLCLRPDGMAVEASVQDALKQAASALEAAGWTVEEGPCPSMQAAAEVNATLWMAETHLVARAPMVKENDPDALFVFEQMTRDLPEPDLAGLMTTLQTRVGLMRDWQEFFAQRPLLLCPSSGEAPFEQQADVASAERFQQVFDAQLPQRAIPALGLPGLNVATRSEGPVPMGVQLVADRYREDILFDAGRVIEAAMGVPQPCDPTPGGTA